MKHKIIVVGIGPGSLDYISPLALKNIQTAKFLIGSKRSLEYFATDNQISCRISSDISKSINFIREKIFVDDVVVMVSGDPGFYSMLEVLKNEFIDVEIEVIPSISSLQLAFAKIGMSWFNATLLSFHGRRPTEEQLKFEHKKIIGMLTDNFFNSHSITEILLANGWSPHSNVAICSNLSYEDERIIQTTLEEALKIDVVKCCVMIVY